MRRVRSRCDQVFDALFMLAVGSAFWWVVLMWVSE